MKIKCEIEMNNKSNINYHKWLINLYQDIKGSIKCKD